MKCVDLTLNLLLKAEKMVAVPILIDGKIGGKNGYYKTDKKTRKNCPE